MYLAELDFSKCCYGIDQLSKVAVWRTLSGEKDENITRSWPGQVILATMIQQCSMLTSPTQSRGKFTVDLSNNCI